MGFLSLGASLIRIDPGVRPRATGSTNARRETYVPQTFIKLELMACGGRVDPGQGHPTGIERWSENPRIDGSASSPGFRMRELPLHMAPASWTQSACDSPMVCATTVQQTSPCEGYCQVKTSHVDIKPSLISDGSDHGPFVNPPSRAVGHLNLPIHVRLGYSSIIKSGSVPGLSRLTSFHPLTPSNPRHQSPERRSEQPETHMNIDVVGQRSSTEQRHAQHPIRMFGGKRQRPHIADRGSHRVHLLDSELIEDVSHQIGGEVSMSCLGIIGGRCHPSQADQVSNTGIHEAQPPAVPNTGHSHPHHGREEPVDPNLHPQL